MNVDLRDIQANVVTGYPDELGLHRAEFVYAHVEAGHAAEGRAFLRELFPFVTSAAKTTDCKETGFALNVALSHAGLVALELPSPSLWSFQPAFRRGMRKRASLLADRPETWQDEWASGRPEVHILLSLFATDSRIDEQLASLERLVADAPGIRQVGRQSAGRLQDGDSFNREHFGFVDGISNPAVTGVGESEPIAGKRVVKGKVRRGRPIEREWATIAAGEFLLGHVDEAGKIENLEPEILGRNGSFLVLRKLYQNVAAFRGYLQAESKRLGLDTEKLAEKLVGRRRDGTPLTDCDSADPNDFDYSRDPGTGCPLGSHIRRMNPRVGDESGDPQRKGGRRALPDRTARHRIIRRGIPYGPPLEGSEDDEVDRGLLFLAFNANFERQFEFLQARYAEDGDAARQSYDKDPLIGRNEEKGSMVIPEDGRPPRIAQHLPTFVETLGGEYFFTPSLNGLRWIGEGRW